MMKQSGTTKASGARMVLAAFALTLAFGGSARGASDTFRKPTQEELSMKSLPGYPGAPAVVLYKEEITFDDLHSVQRYERIKILTDEGKKYANVELSFWRTDYDSDFGGNDKTVGEIQGRTIHADGTIIPFTGKPYEKTIEKVKGVKFLSKVFTLPDVEVGSIIEYRYTTRISDHMFEDPQWYIQGDLYVMAAHYVWHPTSRELVDSQERPINAIAWFPILPPGADMKRSVGPSGDSIHPESVLYELSVKDIPPTVEEDYMPPLKSYSYRLLFSSTAFNSRDDYWKSQGKEWSNHANSFMKQNGDLGSATQTVIAGANTPDEKLHKIYAKVMSLENTDYTRERDQREQSTVNTVSDVLKNGRGSPYQLTSLFVAMARSAGMKSYLMLVPDRSEHFFTPQWLSMQQLDNVIAIVSVDGKDVFFDPGSRYCSYGHLAWPHMFTNGLRQTDGAPVFADAAGDGYASDRTTRVANLQMDEHGQITGKIDVSFTGAEALRWRHVALRGDEQSLKEKLREMLEERVPHSLEVKVDEIKNVSDYEQPLQVAYEVNGTLGAPTGKRLVMPVDLFESNSATKFSQKKRETAVDFEYPQAVQDAVRVNFKHGFEVEALPKGDKFSLEKRALYSVTVESTPTSFTTHRSFFMGDIIFVTKDYPALRTFYSQMQTKDKESVVLKTTPVTATVDTPKAE
jgi:hypothetical protein